MKKLFFAALFVSIGMLSQAYMDRSNFRKAGLVIAENSFHTGCLIQGRDTCDSLYPSDKDRDILFRDACLSAAYDDCEKKANEYGNAFAAGPQR